MAKNEIIRFRCDTEFKEKSKDIAKKITGKKDLSKLFRFFIDNWEKYGIQAILSINIKH